MNKKTSAFTLKLENQELIKSLLYTLERKFKNLKIAYDKKKKQIITDQVDDAIKNEIAEIINDYNEKFARIERKIKSKEMWSLSFKNETSRDIPNFDTDISGIHIFKDANAEIIYLLDKIFKNFCLAQSAKEIIVPSVISKENLIRAKYLPREEHQICQLNSLDGRTGACLSPAACLPLYPSFENVQLPANTVSYTFNSYVYRYEGGVFSESSLDRSWEYQIREFVQFYSVHDHEELLGNYSNFMEEFCTHMKLTSKQQTACDTFFHNELSKMSIHQLLLSKKYEVIYINNNVQEVALSSFNIHDTSFTKEFNISGPESDQKSLCIGWGLFRILKAILETTDTDYAIKNLSLFLEKRSQNER